jgi:hypothetical protein
MRAFFVVIALAAAADEEWGIFSHIRDAVRPRVELRPVVVPSTPLMGPVQSLEKEACDPRDGGRCLPQGVRTFCSRFGHRASCGTHPSHLAGAGNEQQQVENDTACTMHIAVPDRLARGFAPSVKVLCAPAFCSRVEATMVYSRFK